MEHRIVRSLLSGKKKKSQYKHVLTTCIKGAGLSSGRGAMDSFIPKPALGEQRETETPCSFQWPSISSKLG